MRLPTIFLDDGGVMNDNDIRGRQWEALVAEYLAPRLGGEPARWGEANRIVAERLWAEYSERMAARPQDGYRRAWDAFLTRWFKEMCVLVGVTAPPDEECRSLSIETSAYVTPRIRSAYPGAIDAIRELHDRGYPLRSASGEPSDHLEGYLTGMGVRECFAGVLYGPDTIDTPKSHPLYYQRIFEHAAVAPADAIVVDNEVEALANAAGAGASTVIVSADGASHARIATIASLSDLPDLLQSSISAPGAA
ncbi:MAG: HAD family hydrolase [Dehalococcoidia bacterium]